MSNFFNKDLLKQALTLENIYDLVEHWGGQPEYTDNGLILQTICHNLPGEGSRKLYYYDNTALFHCYTGCIDPSFDIFDLCIKVMKNQKELEWELYDAMYYIASYFGFSGVESNENDSDILEDWNVFKRHQYEQQEKQKVVLKEYDPVILSRFLYPRIKIWEKEGVSAAACSKNLIGYYPGGEQITIPHFDIDGRLIGIRGRALDRETAARFGKYRPLLVNRQLYNHPLSLNLYNLNNSKNAIAHMQTAIVFEGEKSCLKFSSYYGEENDISVAICGSSLSSYHVQLLKQLGIKELVLAFDRQFQEIGDNEFKRLKSKLIHIYNKYSNTLKITAVFDKNMITNYKDSPVDCGKDIFEKLLDERIIPNR